MKKLKFLSVLFLCIVFSASVYAFEIPCKVTRVVDGDTFHCIPISFVSQAKVHKDGTVSVRLRGVDAPEKTQPFGKDAQESLKELIGGETVLLDIKDIDRYGRIVAYVFVRGVNINLEQVKQGMAWAYTEYLDRPYASEFYEAEKQARKEKKGLWKQSNPIPPWEWRKRR